MQTYKSNTIDYVIAAVVGWGLVLLIGLLGVASSWFGAQLALFKQAPPLAWWGMPLMQLLLLGGLALPSALLVVLRRDFLSSKIGETWLWAVAYGLVLLPVQLFGYERAQWTAVAQLGLTLLFGGVFWLRTRENQHLAAQPGGAAWAVALAVMAGAGWLLYGALGSPLDTVLNIAVAAAFGWVATLILRYAWLRHWQNARNTWRHWLVLDLVLSVQLLMMAIGLGAHGQQLYLMFMLPALGWLAAAVLQWGQGDGWNPRYLPLLLGVVAALVLCTFDPDEQNLILSDTFLGMFSAVGLSAAVGWLLGGALLLAHRWVARPRAGQMGVALAVAGLAVALTGVGYAFTGQPGFHGERYFVILKEQADLSDLPAMGDYAARRQAAYQRLTDVAQRSQAPLMQQLQQWRVPYQQFYLVNALEVPAQPLLRWWLLQQPAVDRVIDSPQLRPLPDGLPAQSTGAIDTHEAVALPWGLEQIQAARVHDELNVRGAGIILGESDSGVDGAHPELADGYRATLGWYDPWYGTTSPHDWGGHGTHTTATVLGNSVGVAPDAQWIGCVNLARNLANPPLYLRCLEFMLAPFAPDADPLTAGQPTLGAHVLNNSWGCPTLEGCDALALLPAVRALRAAGVFVVAAAGNDGPGCSTIADPIAIYEDVFTVGAVNEDGDVTSFSSRGPVTVDGSGRQKPDLLAPGERVFSAMPNGTYAYNDGTSMASPHVAGVVALMWAANPALVGQIDATAALLRETAEPYTGTYGESGMCADAAANGLPNPTVGVGVVDAYAAVKAAQQWHP